MALLLAPEEGQLDHVDLLRHVLGNLVVPRTVQDIYDIFYLMQREGTVLPSGGYHIDSKDYSPASLLKELEDTGYAMRFSGFSDLAAMNKATAQNNLLVSHPDPEDEPHARGAYFQTATRGEVWASESTNDPNEPHWIMTKTGFNALTGQEAS